MQVKIIWFIILSIPILLLSWRALINYRSHGFFRFFGWECLLWLIISNTRFWFKDLFSGWQILSWILLIYSGILVLAGIITMKKRGKQDQGRKEDALYRFEKTTELIETGIFRYIRHPLYGSLIFLTLGVFLKKPDWILGLVGVAGIVFFHITAIREESENIAYFGKPYSDYMKRSKKFIPYIW